MDGVREAFSTLHDAPAIYRVLVLQFESFRPTLCSLHDRQRTVKHWMNPYFHFITHFDRFDDWPIHM